MGALRPYRYNDIVTQMDLKFNPQFTGNEKKCPLFSWVNFPIFPHQKSGISYE